MPGFLRRIQPITAWVACLHILTSAAFAQAVKSERPNILLILVDDLGYRDLSVFGTADIRTPNIDSLCRQGMRFDRFYANSPVCAPTRASLMSGRYPDRVGVPGLIRYHEADNWGYLAPGTVLVPSQLKEAGYHTALIGKWNLGLESPNLPNEMGFDLFHGWLEDMMDDYTLKRRHGINWMRRDTAAIDPPGHATDLFSQWAVGYIRERATEKRPFFLFLSYNAPHFPVQPPQVQLERVLKRQPGIDPRRARLVAMIEHLDEGIGRVVAELKRTGAFDNTLIVFTGDNGGHLPDSADNGPLRDGKQSMYEGGLRVPTFFTWPGRIPAGSVSVQVNMSMDITPTLMELAGLPNALQTDGRSFLSVLRGAAPPKEERPLYFVRREGGPKYAGRAYHALLMGDWKLLQNGPEEPMELYNLREDPAERMNRMDRNGYVFKRMNPVLMRHIQEGGRVPWQKPSSRR